MPAFESARCPVSHEVKAAIKTCPFLHLVAEHEGEHYASKIALNPLKRASSSSQPIFPENEPESLAAAFTLFHGDQGVVPLRLNTEQHSVHAAPQGCPFHSLLKDDLSNKASEDTSSQLSEAQRNLTFTTPFAGLPMASISLSGPFGFLVRSLMRV